MKLLTILLSAALWVSPAKAMQASSLQADPPDPYDTYYYEYSVILFGTSVDNEGNIVGESTTFKVGSNGVAKFDVYIENDGEFATEALYFEIYNEDSDLFEDFIIEITPEWNWTKFTYTIDRPGKYFMDVYNYEDTFVNSAEFEITK